MPSSWPRPEHWHGIPMIMACQAGKDVYVEKPISHTIYEGRKMVEAATKYNRVVTCGTQQRSGEHYQKVVEMIRGGKIGKVTYVEAWLHGGGFTRENRKQMSPPDSDPPHGIRLGFLAWTRAVSPLQSQPAGLHGILGDRRRRNHQLGPAPDGRGPLGDAG